MKPFGDDARGSLIYTDSGRFSAQVHRVDRPPVAAGDQLKATEEESAANFSGFVSYYGPYTWDEHDGHVVHHVEGSLFPNWEGAGQERFCRLAGDRLELTTPAIQWGGGGKVVAALVWERVSA